MSEATDKDPGGPIRTVPSLSDLRGFLRWLVTGRLP